MANNLQYQLTGYGPNYNFGPQEDPQANTDWSQGTNQWDWNQFAAAGVSSLPALLGAIGGFFNGGNSTIQTTPPPATPPPTQMQPGSNNDMLMYGGIALFVLVVLFLLIFAFKK